MPKTPFIGRTSELDRLLALSEILLGGLGRACLILGDPGIGKSRLVLEWQQKTRSLPQPAPIRWVKAHGKTIDNELSYSFIKSLLLSALGISELDPPDHLSAILKSALDSLRAEDDKYHYRYLAQILGLPLSDSDQARIDQQDSKEILVAYHLAVKSILRNLASAQPLIVILDDLQLADAASIDLLIELLPVIAASPILVCFVSRTDRSSDGWRLALAIQEHYGPRLARLDLNPLNEQESQALLKGLLGSDRLPDGLHEAVLDKAEGNPYFMSALVQHLVDEGKLIKKKDRWQLAPNADIQKIPEALRALFLAQVDPLSSEACLTLRVASVIGQSFPAQVVKQVLGALEPDIELIVQLNLLETNGLIEIIWVTPELIYAFRPHLLQDSIYDSIADQDRVTLHLSVGTALEALYPERNRELASQLAHHFYKSHEIPKASFYLDLAGHVAIESYAYHQAERFFQQAALLNHDPEQLAHLFTDLGEALAQQSKHRKAIDAWKQAIDHYQALGNTNRLARIHAWSARSAWRDGNPDHSLQICLEGLEVVKNATESPDIAYLIHETGRAYLFINQPEKARAYCERALEMAQRLNSIDVQAETLATIGILPNIKPERAIAALEMAIKLSESHNLYATASRSYINLAAVIDTLGEIRQARDYRMRALQLGGITSSVADNALIEQAIVHASLWLADFDEAQTRIDRMRQISRQADAYLAESTLNELFLLGRLHHFQGDFSQAQEIFTNLKERSRQADDLVQGIKANSALAEIILEVFILEEEKRNLQDLEQALENILEACQPDMHKSGVSDVNAYGVLSTCYMLKGDREKARDAIEKAQIIYRDNPTMEDKIWLHLYQARLAASLENYSTALEFLESGLMVLEKMEGRWWQARLRLEMGILYLKRNEPEDIDQAQNLFREALTEFKDLQVNYYPDVILDKLRQVKNQSRAQAIAHRKITREMAEAGRVQNTFLPTQAPIIPGYQITGALLPANETSGDFFDFFNLDDERLGVVIADVGDKGAGAALYMAMSRTLIRTYAVEGKLAPDEVMREVNRRLLSDTERGIFLTAVFGVLNPRGNTLTYVNAGHNPPFVLKDTGKDIHYDSLEKTGALLGIFEENAWVAQTIPIDPGQTVVLYTDGITEAQDLSGNFFGNERLISILKNEYRRPLKGFRDAILEGIQSFTGNAQRLDDITLVIIRRDQVSPH